MKLVTIQTYTGEEELLKTYMKQLEDQSLVTELFIPKREMSRRIRGEWHPRTEVLFPGYLFVETRDPQTLYFALKKIPKMSKLLADGDYNFFTLHPEEESFIRRIGTGRGDHTFGISQVCIEQKEAYKKGDKVTILSGDLLNYEGEVIGYDFHKRKAMVRSSLFGGSVIHVGIELLKKKEGEGK